MDQNEPGQTNDSREWHAYSERVLVLAPTGDDAAVMQQLLEDRGFSSVIVDGLEALALAIDAGAALALVASEAFDDRAGSQVLRQALERQEPWSEIPLLLFGGSVENSAAAVTELLGSRAQIVLLERPLGVATFVSATDSALRSRRRQYEVRRLIDELAASAAEIKRAHAEATKAKDEFLATLGHELRSPMTAIRGWIEMLKTGTMSAEDSATALAMIESSTKVQARIIEDLMDVSKIIAGKVMIEPALMDLAPVGRGIVATFRTAAEQHEIDLTADITDEPLMVMADETRVQQVGWNLISNAIKFTPAGGAVHVSLQQDGRDAVLTVRDNGNGIQPELLPHIFERYRQGEEVTRRQSAGLGLGLAIVRHLVEGHGGKIAAFSEGLGKGSSFSVRFPLVDPTAGDSE